MKLGYFIGLLVGHQQEHAIAELVSDYSGSCHGFSLADTCRARYLKYREALMKSAIIGSALAAARSYYNYIDMAVDDVMLMLKSTDDFVNELCQVNNFDK